MTRSASCQLFLSKFHYLIRLDSKVVDGKLLVYLLRVNLQSLYFQLHHCRHLGHSCGIFFMTGARNFELFQRMIHRIYWDDVIHYLQRTSLTLSHQLTQLCNIPSHLHHGQRIKFLTQILGSSDSHVSLKLRRYARSIFPGDHRVILFCALRGHYGQVSPSDISCW